MNRSVNCIQASAKSILKSQRHFSSSTSRTIALDQLKKKSPVVCASICLNPHLILQSINICRKSKHLPSHNTLTAYIDQLESLIKDGSKKYKKHRSYVDNCSSVYPMMKDAYSGKFIELDFSQNLALQPKLEVKSAHFFNKQYTLHCAIATPFDRRYHYHLSDDNKHNGIFVDHVLRDLIANYNISNEDLWVQSDNASSQYKNKHSFGLLQSLANEFNLRIIRTYGAEGHGKGAIDAMSSFGVKNILRKDIVTHDVFFNNSCDMAEYLTMKNPQYYYTTISAESLVLARQKDGNPIEFPGCMKQHIIVFKSNEKMFSKEYHCDCTSCLQFDFENCAHEEADNNSDADELEDIFDEELDQSEQIFDFVTVPSFVSLYCGNSIDPLYFVQITGKGVAEDNISDPYGHFIAKGEKYFQRFYLKLGRSRNAKVKRFSTVSTKIVIAPDETYDTYADFSDELELDINVYNMLIRKASC